MARPLNVKLVAVGDGGVGKTCLLISYSYKRFPKDYVPTVFDNWDTLLKIEGQTVKLDLWDTAGQEDYDRLRPLSYPQTDVFLICFSVISPVSYKHARDKWVPEIKHHCPDAVFLLVGTKIDLRDDDDVKFELSKHGEVPVKKEEGERLASKLKAHCYIECSALTQQNLHKVFNESIRAVICPEVHKPRRFLCGLF